MTIFVSSLIFNCYEISISFLTFGLFLSRVIRWKTLIYAIFW